ncbi:MAG: AAA family ATPase [Candidatus Puniceispirillales bacterium]
MYSESNASFKERFPNIKSIKEILSIEYPPQEWLVENILPKGLALLAGPPKLGKSYFVLNLIKKILSSDYGVFYFAGEDDFRRIQTRANQLEIMDERLLVHAGRDAPLTDGKSSTISEIENLLDFHPSIKAVFIDTMQLILPRINKPRDYEAWVHDLKPWADLAQSKNVSILMVHHTRKENNQADYSPYQSILGSQGIIASFDTVMVMSKSKDGNGATLSITGKDVADQEYRLDKKEFGWEVSGSESEASLGQTQDKVFTYIKSNPGSSWSNIKNDLNLDGSYLSKTLKKLIEKSILEETEGYYYTFK